ncbi:MAG: tagatose 1,6-diphosphate aldolase, partial [Anaerolineae bacterium]|nr:tagatose 1,6-diphosphate aldolase [Anaerolineae bacterium]
MNKTHLSLGKWRGLQQCATQRGALVTMAIDQRNNLRQSLRPDNPDAVTPAEMVTFKTEVVSVLSQVAPSVLMDPEVGAAQCVAAGALSGQNGLMVAVEATGYAGNATERQSRLLPNWGVAKSRRMGASAVKLLVYYHPDAPNARDMEDFVKQVAEDSLANDIAFFLEPLSYSPDPSKKNLASEEKRRVVIASARNLVVPGVDVVKAEFPLEIKEQPDERHWAEACAELSAACAVPWVLLSAGVNYEIVFCARSLVA